MSATVAASPLRSQPDKTLHRGLSAELDLCFCVECTPDPMPYPDVHLPRHVSTHPVSSIVAIIQTMASNVFNFFCLSII